MAHKQGSLTWLRRKDAIQSFLKRSLIAVPILALVAWGVVHFAHPRHEGKTAEEWILELANAPANAERSIQDMNDKAIPAIDRMLGARDSAFKERLRTLTQPLPEGVQPFRFPAREQRQLAALACCALHEAPETVLPIVIKHLADDEGIEDWDSFVSRRQGHDAPDAPLIKNSPADWIRTGPGIVSTNRNLTSLLSSYGARDLLTVFCGDASSASLPAMLEAADSRSGKERRRLMIGITHTLRVLGAFPQDDDPRNQPRVILAPDWFGTEETCMALGQQLLAMASDGDDVVRASVVYALGVMLGCGIEIPKAAETLKAAAKDNAEVVRIRFAQAVANMPFETEGFLRLAADLANDRATEVQTAAVNAMQFHLMTSSVRFEDLEPLFDHGNKVIRFEAVRALGQSREGPKTAIPALLAQLEQADGEAWYAARSAFRRLSRNHRKDCVSALTKACRHESPVARARAAQTLAVIDKDSRSTQIFVVRTVSNAEILNHADPRVVRDAIMALTALDSRAATDGVPVLLKFLSAPSRTRNKAYAAIALATLGAKTLEQVLPVLEELLNDANSDTVAGAVRAAEMLGPAAGPLLPRLKELGKDKRSYNRHEISWANGTESLAALARRAAANVNRTN